MAVDYGLSFAGGFFEHAELFVVGGLGEHVVGGDPVGGDVGGKRDQVAGEYVCALGTDVDGDLSGGMAAE